MNPLEARRRLLGRNVYKRTTEGNPAIAQGSLARRYPGITMQGWTEQDSTTGAQLWDEANEAEYVNGRRYVFHCEPNTDYTFSTDVTVDSLGVLYGEFNNENVLAVKYNATELTFNSGEYDTLYMQVYNPENFGDIKVMLNAGSTVLPYELYTGGAPSPSPDYPQEITSAGKYNEETGKYEYGLRMTGKNLWSRPQPEEWTYSSVQPGYSDFKIYVGKNEKITFSFEKKPQLGSGIYCGIVLTNNGDIEQWLINNVDDSKNTQSATLITIEDFIWVRAYSKGIEALLNNFPDFQIEYGEKRTGQSVTLTSDRPLTKWDKLEKRNGQWGWVYKSAEIVLDGSEDERWSLYSNYNGFLCSGVLNAIYSRTAGMCNQGVVDQGGGTGTPNTIWLSGNTATIYWINNSYFDSGLEDEGLQNLKDHLSQIPVIIWYETAEATFVPLSSSEQEQMNALHTFRPTTVLSNDCECEMTLTYKTKKSLEVTT